jgi:transglutaminase/protease-like cytokinesis protein 3
MSPTLIATFSSKKAAFSTRMFQTCSSLQKTSDSLYTASSDSGCSACPSRTASSGYSDSRLSSIGKTMELLPIM